MPVDPKRVKAIFQAVVELHSGRDRVDFLDQECGGDTELRQRLEELLAAFERPASELERPLVVVVDPTTDPGGMPEESGPTATFQMEDPAALVGTVIAGRYRLRQTIGE